MCFVCVYQLSYGLLCQICLLVIWQSEEILKVCLNVVQNGSEGYIREILYHCHAEIEQSRSVKAVILAKR